MTAHALSDADVRAILRLLSEAEHVTQFRLRYGDLVIELSNPAPQAADGERTSPPNAVDDDAAAGSPD